ARELESRNIGHGDRIIICAANSPEWIVAFYGAMLRGAIIVPLDEQSSPQFFENVCALTLPKLVLNDQSSLPSVPEIASLNLGDILAMIARHSTEHFEAENISGSDRVEIVFT